MASRYHWVTTGVDTQFNFALPSAQATGLILPAGAQIKRFLIRKTFFQAANNGTGGTYAFPISIEWNVHFTAGPNSGRSIWSSYRAVPFNSVIFSPITGSNVYCWWWGGDNELGVNEKSTYGTAAGATETIACTYSALATRSFTMTNLIGEFGFEFAVLYYL